MPGLEEELAKLRDGYCRALEKAFERVPIRNGVVSVEDLWLETAIPVDLIVELLESEGVKIPPHVERVDFGNFKRKR
ncbi:MAG: hypothetical protein N2507_02815 [Candidatus Bipolaricaulota bacterium]|nr:hypothetical protein [Candidatus Bipolaricaulota bacterium]MCX7844277.1 hypothetical protein [Candidatus Bipolaricaulota bacterium]MDW8151898.1 hypothetical protein [Candidatus Bipolaricaulota bacterium]